MGRVGTGMALAGVTMTLAAFGVAGCASRTSAGHGPGSVGMPGPPTTSAPTTADCSGFKAAAASGPGGVFGFSANEALLPADFQPTALVTCMVDPQDIPGQGSWLVLTTRRSTTSVAGFVAAFRDAYAHPPSTVPPAGNFGCAAVGNISQWLVLSDANGKAFQVTVPLDGVCHEPDAKVDTALKAVAMAVVSTERLKQISTPSEQAAGCDPAWKNMPMIQAGSDPTPKTTAPPGPIQGMAAGTKLKACFYKFTDAGGDPNTPTGSFESGAEISGSQATSLLTGLAAAPYVIPGCTAKGSEFVVLLNDDGMGKAAIEVELDGCKRLWTSAGPLRQPSQAVIDALLAARK